MIRPLALALAAVLGAAGSGWADPAALYTRWCAVCHGPAGQGDGPAAALLSPPPRDFTAGIYKLRSTPSGSLPTPADVAASIARGLPGTSMPAYGDLLAADEIETLARHVLGLAPPDVPVGRAIDLGNPLPDDAAARRRGARLYADLGCGACHGEAGRGVDWTPPREGPGGPAPPTVLAEPWTFRGGAAPAAIARRILTGLDGSPMPGYAGQIAPGDAWALAWHVLGLARRPAWEETAPAAIRDAGVATDSLARGRYLVNAMLCPLCHTPISPDAGVYDTRFFLAGGMRVVAYPWGVWYSRNLTPDVETGLGGWSERDVVRALRRGETPDGRRLDPFAMPWPWFARLTDADARAIAAYLASLEPVRNPVPAPIRVVAVEAVGAKLLALLGAEASVDFWGGNAATETALRALPPAPAGRRQAAWAVGAAGLALALGLVVAGGLRRRRWWLAAGLVALGSWGLLAVWPPVGLLPPALTVRWLFLGAPALPGALSAPDRALAERGAYVAGIAPCGLCHTPTGAFAGFWTGRALAGGMEARWRVYGSAVSTNLTPHPEGIAGVSDALLLRAIRSGIGRDGRAMHWQAMPWDIGSRWSPEDLRALVAYLRALPPVAGRVPPPRGPRPGDPPADSFLFGDAAIRR